MSRSIACIDYRNGKVFIAKRQMKGDMGGRWEFPGGKIEENEGSSEINILIGIENEDFETAIKREMMEEFGVDVTVGRHITSSKFFHKKKECFLDAFEVHFAHDGIQNPFVLTEHTDYRWENIENIPKLCFVDSDLAIYDNVKKWCTK